ncbi:GntR family transcriptional regulator [Brevibacterium litoralis]|uniref:GntR family transcriptional regulator n=1 Tax=Brevibacterium litoralis TaxID=3138935 RepID=UPI0032EE6EE6
MAERVIRERIASGALGPGEKLGEVGLAADLQVSRNTLREVFAALDGDGLVDRVPHRGVFVASPGRALIDEVFRLRTLLEPAALLWAPDLDVPALRTCVDAARAARDRADNRRPGTSSPSSGHSLAPDGAEADTVAGSTVPSLAEANQEFHRTIVAAAGSAYVDAVAGRALALMRLAFHRAAAVSTGFHEPYVERNAAIVDLLEAGERAAAAERMRDYLHRARAELLTLLPD